MLFESKVRQETIKKISVKNPTDSDWVLTPVIQNSFWSGDSIVKIASGSSEDYELTYCPLEMTADHEDEMRKNKPEKHSGSVFFPLPNGSAIIYNLSGTADKPDPEKVIEESAPCKMNKGV